MKKLLTIALILCTLTASAQMRGGSQFDPGAARAADTYDKGEVESLITQTAGLLRYYVNPAASDVGGYYRLDEQVVAVASEVTTPSLSTSTMTLMRSSITDAGEPGITALDSGVYLGSVVAQRTGVVDVQMKFALYKRNLAGTETLIGESGAYVLGNTDKTTVQVAVVVPAATAMLVTDRLVLKTYAARVGGTGTPTITFFYGDGNQTFFSVTAPGGAIYARANLTNITSGSALGVANGGTGATTAAAGLAALGGASLNGSSTVAFNALSINGVAPLTAAEKTQALVGSSTVDFLARNITSKDYFVAASNATATVVTTAFVNASFTESIDGDSAFADSVYTAPQTGLYVVTGHCRTAETAWSAVGDALLVRLAVNGTTQSDTIGVGFVQVAATYQLNCAFSGVVRLTAGQTLSVRIYSARATTMDTQTNYNFVNIYKLASD